MGQNDVQNDPIVAVKLRPGWAGWKIAIAIHTRTQGNR